MTPRRLLILAAVSLAAFAVALAAAFAWALDRGDAR